MMKERKRERERERERDRERRREGKKERKRKRERRRERERERRREGDAFERRVGEQMEAVGALRSGRSSMGQGWPSTVSCSASPWRKAGWAFPCSLGWQRASFCLTFC